MPFTPAGKNRMLDAMTGVASGSPVTHASLHSAIPDDTGSNELTGGSYARKAISYNAASGGSKAKDASNPVFDVPAATSVFFLGHWTAITGGTFMWWGPINGGATNGVGTAAATGDVITSYAHGCANNDRVFFRPGPDGTLPAGLSATVIYFVINANTNSYQVSLTQGGAAVDITADGELAFTKVIPETYGSAGTLTVTADTFDLNALG